MSAFTNNLNNATRASNGLHNQQPGQLNDQGINTQGGLHNQHGASNSLHNSTGIQSDALHDQHHPGQLNENHGIAASGLQGNNLNYTGVPISDINKVDQQDTHGLTGAAGPGAAAIGSHEHNNNNNLGNNNGLGYDTGLGNNFGRDNHHTGTAFAGTAASLGSTAQPQTHSRVGDNLAHTGQPKTHGAIDDLASSRSHTNDHHHSGVATGAAGAGATALGAHEYNKYKNNDGHHSASVSQGLNDTKVNSGNNNGLTSTGLGHNNVGLDHNNDGFERNTSLGRNDGTHKDYHAGAAGAGVAALGAHEHNKHNNGLNNSGVTDYGLHNNDSFERNTGLGSNDGTHKDHHAGAAGAGVAALGAHEHNKHNNGLNNSGVTDYGLHNNDSFERNTGLGSNDGTHKDHHAGAAGAGVAALGAHEHNKHNNGLNNSGVTDYGLHNNSIHNDGLGHNNSVRNDGLHKDHHAAVAASTGASALGAHEYNKHHNNDDHRVSGSTGASALRSNEHNKYPNTTHAGGAVSAVEGDHGFSNHNKTGATGAAGATTEEPGIHDSRGVRHAGVPLHEGFIPVQKDSPHQAGANDSGSPTKVKTGDKIKGNLEKIVGKVTGNEAKVIEGDMIAHGNAGNTV